MPAHGNGERGRGRAFRHPNPRALDNHRQPMMMMMVPSSPPVVNSNSTPATTGGGGGGSDVGGAFVTPGPPAAGGGGDVVDDENAREMEALNAFLACGPLPLENLRRGDDKGSWRPMVVEEQRTQQPSNAKVQSWEEQGWDYPLVLNKPVVVLEAAAHGGRSSNWKCYNSFISGVCVGGVREECSICGVHSSSPPVVVEQEQAAGSGRGRGEPHHQREREANSDGRRNNNSSHYNHGGPFPPPPPPAANTSWNQKKSNNNHNNTYGQKNQRGKKHYRHKRDELPPPTMKPKKGGIFGPAQHPSFQEELGRSQQSSQQQELFPPPPANYSSTSTSSSSSSGAVDVDKRAAFPFTVAGAASAFPPRNNGRNNNAFGSQAFKAGNRPPRRRPVVVPDRASYSPDFEHTKFADLFNCMQGGGGKYASGIDAHRRFPIGIPVKVNVAAILEPSVVFVQGKWEKRELAKMKQELAGEPLSVVNPAKIRANLYVAVAVRDKDYFYRGQVEAVEKKSSDSSGGVCRVRLVDKGFTVVCSADDLYNLPSKYLQTRRLILALNFVDITLATKGDKEAGVKTSQWLKSQLLGKQVFVTITHGLACAPGVLAYGLIHLADESRASVSELLIIEGLAVNKDEKEADGLIVSQLNPQFPNFPHPRLKPGDTVEANTSHVNQPNDFYILLTAAREKEEARSPSATSEIRHGLDTCKTYALTTRFEAGGSLVGDRMCIAPDPTDEHAFARAFCEEIDFTQESPTALIYYIDHGLRRKIELSKLNEYHKILEKHPPLAYHCQIGVKPPARGDGRGGGGWRDEWRRCLQNAGGRGQHYPISVTCISTTSDSSLVSIKLPGASQNWETALVELGGGVDESKSSNEKNEPKNFRMPDSKTFEKFLKPTVVVNPEVGEDEVVSKYFFRNEPAPPLQEGDVLKTSRLTGYYLYLVMTEEAYDQYNRLREYIRSYVKSAPNDDYEYCVGDMALVPWGAQKYQRCVITGFHNESHQKKNGGLRMANVVAFDIERRLQVSVSRLRQVDEHLLSIGRLSHVVWLEGSAEWTATYSQEFNKIMDLCNGWTTLKKYEENQGKYVVRLAVGNEQEEESTTLLSGLIQEGGRWMWEKYFDIGLYQQSSLCSKLTKIPSTTLSIHSFFTNTAIYWSDMAAPSPVQITEIRLDTTQNPPGKKVLIKAIPRSDTVTRDYKLLQEKLIRFYDLAKFNSGGTSDSPIYPAMVAYRYLEAGGIILSGAARGTSSGSTSTSMCAWHRGMYREQINGYQCVDCFHVAKVDKNADFDEIHQSEHLDIRELCAEFLKIPPIGQRFVCELPVSHANPTVKKLIEDVLNPGNVVEVCLAAKNTKPEWVEHGQMVQPVAIQVPELSRRLKETLEKLLKDRKDAPSEAKP